MSTKIIMYDHGSGEESICLVVREHAGTYDAIPIFPADWLAERSIEMRDATASLSKNLCKVLHAE